MLDLITSQLSVILGRDHDRRLGTGADWPRRSVYGRLAQASSLSDASMSEGCLVGVGGMPRYSSTRNRSLEYISMMSSAKPPYTHIP